MKWFGNSWGAPVCDPKDHEPVPVNESCGFCTEPIRETDQGVIMPYMAPDGDTTMAAHLFCFKRSLGIG